MLALTAVQSYGPSHRSDNHMLRMCAGSVLVICASQATRMATNHVGKFAR